MIEAPMLGVLVAKDRHVCQLRYLSLPQPRTPGALVVHSQQ